MKKKVLYGFKFILFFCPCLLLFQNGLSQDNHYIDSLESKLKTAAEDTNRVILLNLLSFQYTYTDLEKATVYANSALHLADSINFKIGKAHSWNNIGTVYLVKENYGEAMDYYEKALEIYSESGNEAGAANCYNNIGVLYDYLGNFEMALEQHLHALKIREKLNNKKGIAMSYDNIGIIYNYLGNFEKALEYEQKAAKIIQETGDFKQLAQILNNMGILFFKLKEFNKALQYSMQSYKIEEGFGDKKGMGMSLNNIGEIYDEQKKFTEALKYYRQSLDLKKEMDDKHGMAGTLNNISGIYRNLKNYDVSIATSLEGIGYASEIKSIELLKDLYNSIAVSYESMNDYKNAYRFFLLFSELKDSLFNEKNQKQIAEMQSKYESEKKDNEIKLLNKDKEKQAVISEAESRKQKIIIWSVFGGLLLVTLFASIIFSGYKQKKKANFLLAEKNEIIENKNKDITDSINYAQRIQEAILPAKEIKYRIFPDAFVLFKPKDIVSGDFYWFTEKNGKKIIAACDCTGHGVPGAFMSMIGNAFLNEIVNEKGITTPSEILNQLREIIILTLKQNEGENKDGMDISLLCFDEKNSVVEFAGANNPLWFIRNGSFREIEADRQPIGYYSRPLA